MNIKVLPKIALGSLCIAAASIGVNKCSNSVQKNKDEIDSFICNTTQEPQNYNVPLRARLKKSPAEMQQYTQEYGINGSSIYLQHWLDMTKGPSASQIIFNNTVKTNDSDNEDKIEIYKKLQNIAERTEERYNKQYEQDMKDSLFGNGMPDKDACNKFLEQKFDELHYGLSEAEYLNKLNEFEDDINHFKAQQEAELFAYKQYKIDSILNAKILQKTLGKLMKDQDLGAYEYYHFIYKGKPKY